MRIVIITQNEPFYLSKNIDTLLKRLPDDHIVVGAVVTSASPFGKKENFFEKAVKTKKVFGLSFFIYYSFNFIYNKVFHKSVAQILSKYRINKIEYDQR